MFLSFFLPTRFRREGEVFFFVIAQNSSFIPPMIGSGRWKENCIRRCPPPFFSKLFSVFPFLSSSATTRTGERGRLAYSSPFFFFFPSLVAWRVALFFFPPPPWGKRTGGPPSFLLLFFRFLTAGLSAFPNFFFFLPSFLLRVKRCEGKLND